MALERISFTQATASQIVYTMALSEFEMFVMDVSQRKIEEENADARLTRIARQIVKFGMCATKHQWGVMQQAFTRQPVKGHRESCEHMAERLAARPEPVEQPEPVEPSEPKPVTQEEAIAQFTAAYLVLYAAIHADRSTTHALALQAVIADAEREARKCAG